MERCPEDKSLDPRLHCALRLMASYSGEPCVCSKCSAHGMTSASKVPLDKSRRGLIFHYKSFHSAEVAGFSNLNANIGDNTGAEDDSVELINSEVSFDRVKAVDDLLKEDPGKPWSKKTPETAGSLSSWGSRGLSRLGRSG